MHLIYFDPECTGYHTGHVKLFADHARDDARIQSLHFVLSPDFEKFDRHGILDSIGACAKFSLEYCDAEVARLCLPGQGLRATEVGEVRWREARRLLIARPGAIFFDSLFDSTLYAAAVNRTRLPGVATGIIHFCANAQFDTNWRRKLKLLAVYFLAKRADIPIVLTFDKIFAAHGPRLITRNWRAVPDPLPLSAEQFARLTQTNPSPAREGVEFLLFGSLGAHKGLFNLLDALALITPEAAAKISVRILGVVSEGGARARQHLIDSVTALQAKGMKLVFDERFASEDELIDALTGCDVVLAPYLNHGGVSSVLIWAAAAGRPVITQDTGWMAWVADRYRLGFTCNTSDPHALAGTIALASSREALRNYHAEQLRAFAGGHSAADFYNAVIENLTAIGH